MHLLRLRLAGCGPFLASKVGANNAAGRKAKRKESDKKTGRREEEGRVVKV